MSLTSEQMQELKELEELDALEAKFGGAQPVAKPAEGRPGQAALEGYGQTASMGYLPQLQAAAEPAMASLMDLFTGNKVADSLPSYVNRRDENIARQSQLSEQNPGASLAGKAAGIGATLLAPAGQLAKGASTAAKIGRGSLMGAAQGAAYNPGDEAGVVAPVQAGPRAANAAMGGAAGGIMSGIGAGVSKLAGVSRDVEKIKDSAGLSRGVKAEINQALEGVTRNEVAPRAEKLTELLKGKDVSVNADLLKGVDPRIDRIVDRAASMPGTDGMSTMAAKNAQRLKRVLDSEANYGASKPFDTSAVARGESAKTAADILRGKISGVDPQVGELNSGMGEAIRLRDALAKSSSSAPISSIRGAPGTDKGSLIDAIDKMSGSNLEGLSSGIDSSKGLLMKPSNFFRPLEASNEAKKAGIRAAAGVARGSEALMPGESQMALLRAALEAKRVK